MNDETGEFPVLPALPGMRGLLAASVVLFLSAVVLLAVTLANQPAAAWAPLTPYADQKVLSQVAGVKGPAVKLVKNGVTLVEVSAVKCSRENIRVRGSSAWQSIEPAGAILNVTSGVAYRPKGCESRTYQNPVPPDVAALVRAGGPQLWVIAGTETPIRADGTGEGVPAAWRTEEFRVIP